MSATGLTLDASSLLRGINRMNDKLDEGIERGVTLAAMRLKRDADMETPMVPKDTGMLEGSASVLINNKLVEADGPDSATQGDAEIGKGEFVAQVGFNAPHAAYQHEGMRQDGSRVVQEYKQSGRGPKFLEKPLTENAYRYMKIAAHEIGRAL